MTFLRGNDEGRRGNDGERLVWVTPETGRPLPSQRPALEYEETLRREKLISVY